MKNKVRGAGYKTTILLYSFCIHHFPKVNSGPKDLGSSLFSGSILFAFLWVYTVLSSHDFYLKRNLFIRLYYYLYTVNYRAGMILGTVSIGLDGKVKLSS